MQSRLIIAAVAIAALPLSMAAAESKSGKAAYSTKRICKVEGETGSRLGGVKRCRTQQEWDALKRETRDQIDRAQNLKTHTGG
jgi:hypothetical protein